MSGFESFFIAPELYEECCFIEEQDEQLHKVDVWSLGVILYTLVTGGETLALGHQSAKAFDLLEEEWAHFPLELHSFVKCCLKYDPDERLSVNELLDQSLIRMYQAHSLNPNAQEATYTNVTEVKTYQMQVLSSM